MDACADARDVFSSLGRSYICHTVFLEYFLGSSRYVEVVVYNEEEIISKSEKL